MHDWTPGQWFRATDSIKINDADREEPLYLHPNRPLQVGRIDGDALFFTVSDGSEWGVFAGDPNLEAIAEHLVPLCELGVRWGTGYGDNKERLSTFKLPLTPEQWVNVCDKEGRWLGVCCGNISSMRDIMIYLHPPGERLDLLRRPHGAGGPHAVPRRVHGAVGGRL
jgi:hypothetical protein